MKDKSKIVSMRNCVAHLENVCGGMEA